MTLPEGTNVQHKVNESADKLKLSTKLKRGTGTRDQDAIKVVVKGNDPVTCVNNLNHMLELLTETVDSARSMQPEGEDGD